MEGRAHRQQDGARAAPSAANAIARSTAVLWPLTTTWPGALSLAASQTSPWAAAAATSRAASISSPNSAAIAPNADRHRALHRQAAPLQETRRVGEVEGVRGGERRILAHRMTGDEGDLALQVELAVPFQDSRTPRD